MVESDTDLSIFKQKIDWIECAMYGCQLLAKHSLLDDKFYLEFKSKIEENITKLKELKSVDADHVSDFIVSLDDD